MEHKSVALLVLCFFLCWAPGYARTRNRTTFGGEGMEFQSLKVATPNLHFFYPRATIDPEPMEGIEYEVLNVAGRTNPLHQQLHRTYYAEDYAESSEQGSLRRTDYEELQQLRDEIVQVIKAQELRRQAEQEQQRDQIDQLIKAQEEKRQAQEERRQQELNYLLAKLDSYAPVSRGKEAEIEKISQEKLLLEEKIHEMALERQGKDAEIENISQEKLLLEEKIQALERQATCINVEQIIADASAHVQALAKSLEDFKATNRCDGEIKKERVD